MITDKELNALEKKIGYKFKNRKLLLTALTHSSFSNDDKKNKIESYERMEFFGDSILSFVVSEVLFSKYLVETEGKLTKLRALVVCEETLAKSAVTIGLSKYIVMSNGGIYSGGRDRPSILADVIEAIICSIFLDGGMDPARNFTLKILKKYIQLAYSGTLIIDYKSTLQEYGQARLLTVEYLLNKVDGPVHDRDFEYFVIIDGNTLGTGSGKTKKEAQQNAAKQAVVNLNLDFS
ncbi:MAG: ribonuclease III [Bacillota bacterium]